MQYKIELLLQQGDTTGNKPIIDVLWNSNTVVSSYTISTALDTSKDWEELSFFTNDMQPQNNLEIVYKNKPTDDATNDYKIVISSIDSYELVTNPNPPSNVNPYIDSIYFDNYFINKSEWTYSNISIDGVEQIVNSDSYPILQDHMNPIIIKNASANLLVNYPFTMITANTYTLGQEYSNVDDSLANLIVGTSIVKVN
jgi:hypothetical protein